MQTTVVEPLKRLNVGLHFGNVIKYLAETYGTGFEVLREAVQNAIDKVAKNIYVKIDCATRVISVFDDGDGAGESEIMKKFDQVGLSLKLGQPGMVGQKGIGNLAAFAIGRTWQLLTRDIKAGEKLRCYTFESAELLKSENISLQSEVVAFKSVTGAPFPATTVLRIVDVDNGVLKQLGDKGTIERTLREAFNAKLKGGKVTLRVSYKGFKGQTVDFVVKPTRFRGTPLEAVEYETDHGPVTFEFYHSHEPVKDPAILVQHEGVYNIPLSNFFKLRILPSEIESSFSRGYFEGEIRLSFCKLNSSRSAFEHGVEQTSFVSAIERFSTEILRPLTEQFEQTDRKEKIKKVVETALKRMKQLLKQNPGLFSSGLSTLMKKKGDKGLSPEFEDITISPTAGTKKNPLPANTFKKQRERSREKNPRPKKPVLQLHDGLAIEVVNPEADEGFSWHSRRTAQGIIQVNAMNNTFTEAERRGKSVLGQYIFILLQKEMSCASMNPHEGAIFDQGFERTYLSFWRASLTE